MSELQSCFILTCKGRIWEELHRSNRDLVELRLEINDCLAFDSVYGIYYTREAAEVERAKWELI